MLAKAQDAVHAAKTSTSRPAQETVKKSSRKVIVMWRPSSSDGRRMTLALEDYKVNPPVSDQDGQELMATQ
jgi:hypothetical protein